MLKTWVRSLGWEDLLEKGKATHSSILAWRVPWTVQSVGLQGQTRLSAFHITGYDSVLSLESPRELRSHKPCSQEKRVLWERILRDLLQPRGEHYVPLNQSFFFFYCTIFIIKFTVCNEIKMATNSLSLVPKMWCLFPLFVESRLACDCSDQWNVGKSCRGSSQPCLGRTGRFYRGLLVLSCLVRSLTTLLERPHGDALKLREEREGPS